MVVGEAGVSVSRRLAESTWSCALLDRGGPRSRGLNIANPRFVAPLTRVLPALLQATYIMFHFVEGVPFESNSGVYDKLTMWEQIDGGAQYTPAKKWLTSLPIILYVGSGER